MFTFLCPTLRKETRFTLVRSWCSLTFLAVWNAIKIPLSVFLWSFFFWSFVIMNSAALDILLHVS